MKRQAMGKTIIAISIATLFPFPVHSQTTTGEAAPSSTQGASTPTSTAPNTTSSATAPATAIGASTAATGATLSKGEARYASRVASRYGDMAGSTGNLEKLIHALRTGTPVTLAGATAPASTGTSATPSTSTTSTSAGATPSTSTSSTSASATPSTTPSSGTSFTPATRPMGYGNITRTLELARRQLATSGIANPTPQDLAAVLNGGTVKTAQGSTTFQGILKLRSEGMGWGKIAHTVGVHPGMGKGGAHSAAATTTSAQSTAASGNATATQGNGSQVTSASAGATASTSAKGATSAAGGTAGSKTSGNGIVTASGPTPVHGSAKAANVKTSIGVSVASRGATSSGVSNAGGAGHHGNGHPGKR